MSIGTVLREMVDGCAGGIGAMLTGYDGVAIEQVLASSVPPGPMADDLATAGVEFGRLLVDMRKASDAVAGGALIQASVDLSRFTLLFANVDDETFLVLALSPNGNRGKARYLIRRHMPALRQLL